MIADSRQIRPASANRTRRAAVALVVSIVPTFVGMEIFIGIGSTLALWTSSTYRWVGALVFAVCWLVFGLIPAVFVYATKKR